MDQQFPAGFGVELEREYQKLTREHRPVVAPQVEPPSRVPEAEIQRALKGAARDQAAIRKGLK